MAEKRVRIADMKFDPPPPMCFAWRSVRPTFHQLCQCVRDEGHDGRHQCKCYLEWEDNGWEQ